MKMMTKVMAVVTIMTLTVAMPAVAGNKKHNDRRADKVVVVVKDKKAPAHFDKRSSHFAPRPVAHRPNVKVCTFKVSRHTAHRKNVVAAAERIHGVMNATFNPRTGMMTVQYDAHRTTPRIIRHVVA